MHVELDGLLPGREYFYRFRAERLRLAGRPHPHRAGAVARSAARWRWRSSPARSTSTATSPRTGGWPRSDPDLVLHLGDYQYEYAPDTYVVPGGNPRDHEGPETVTLANYRQRHAQYKTDPDLQAAHAVAPWLVVWDDHEIDNNWADEVPEQPDARSRTSWPGGRRRSRRTTRTCRCAAPSVPRGIDMQLYRRLHWGRLATFHMLDTRQYRDDQGCGDGYQDCPAARRPGPLDHRRRAGGVAARRLPPLGGALGHPRPAGLLRPARQQRRARRR